MSEGKLDMDYAWKVTDRAWLSPDVYVVGYDSDEEHRLAGWCGTPDDLAALVAIKDRHSEGWETFAERVDLYVDGDVDAALAVMREMAARHKGRTRMAN